MRGFGLMLTAVAFAAHCGPSLAAATLTEADVVATVDHVVKVSRYMMEGDFCKPAAADVKSNSIVAPYVVAIEHASAVAKGTKVVECNYKYRPTPTGKFQPGYAVLLDIPASAIGHWIYGACKTNAPKKIAGCAKHLVKYMQSQNGAQYPIAGFVSEGGPDDPECVQNNVHLTIAGLIAFRDGVTIQFKKSAAGEQPIFYCTTEVLEPAVQKYLALNSAAVTAVYDVGRIAAVNRSAWDSTISNKPGKGLDPSGWQATVRKSMIDAITTGDDALFDFQARAYAGKKSANWRRHPQRVSGT